MFFTSALRVCEHHSPHTSLATDCTSAILAHCCSSVSLLPSSVDAKPHWVDRHKRVKRHILGRFGNASLDHFRILKFRLLGSDQTEHNLLISGNLGERLEVAGTIIVELQVVGGDVFLAEKHVGPQWRIPPAEAHVEW